MLINQYNEPPKHGQTLIMAIRFPFMLSNTHTRYCAETNSGATSFKGPVENIHHQQSLSLSCPV